MTQKIDTTKFEDRVRALIVQCETWNNQERGSEAKRFLETALKLLEPETMPHWGEVGEALCKAANIERAEINRLHKQSLSVLFGGESENMFSDALELQAKLPNEEHITPLLMDVVQTDAVLRRVFHDAPTKGEA